MRTLPFDAGGIHFVGIGGIGMSGIAEVLHSLGHRVQGSTSPRTPTPSACAASASRWRSAIAPPISASAAWS